MAAPLIEEGQDLPSSMSGILAAAYLLLPV